MTDHELLRNLSRQAKAILRAALTAKVDLVSTTISVADGDEVLIDVSTKQHVLRGRRWQRAITEFRDHGLLLNKGLDNDIAGPLRKFAYTSMGMVFFSLSRRGQQLAKRVGQC